MAGSDRCNFELMTKDLGKDYEIVKGDFKYYPCCKYIQPTLDAIRHIITENHLQAEDIQSILVKSIRWLKTFEDYEPTNMVDAEFSVPYTAAMVILGETPGPNWYLGEKIRNKKALNIARKVRIEVDPAAERIYQETEQQPSTVEIATKDGRKFDCHIDHSKGEYYNPLTPEELESKFRHNASFVLKEEVIKEIIAIIRKLEQISDINELTALLSSNP
jgi:2-methylcitrate dehydratase PrpD